MTMNAAFVESVRGGFLGLAIGDALGVPVETMSHESILAATGGEGVKGYILPKQTRVKDTENLPAGSTSDDTQLARVTGRSLVRCRRFEIIDQGLALVEEFEASTFGWGGTTTEAAKAIQIWSNTAGREGRHPGLPAPPPSTDGTSAGSGPAMKIFPLAAYDLFGREGGEDEFLSHAMELGLMTHGDPRAVIASYALGIAIGRFAVPTSNLDPAAFRKETADAVLRETKRAENLYVFFRPRMPTLSSQLANAFALMDEPDRLRREVNASFLAIHSVPFAIATALRHPLDFRAAVLEGVNAGKDTDTVGSMIGAMLGSRVGTNGIPSEWIAGLRDRETILAEADALALTVLGVDPHDAKRAMPPWLRGATH